MPADIEQFEGQAAFASARELPWHRLGTVTNEAMTAEQALDLAHMAGWDVRKEALYTNVGGVEIEIADKFAIVRNNPFEPKTDVLGVVGRYYEPTQNEEHAEFLNTFVDASGAHFETAGSLDGGKRTFITMKMPSTILVGGIDPVDTYVVAANSHDGTSSFMVTTTNVRVVCSNTLAAALSGAANVAKVRHTAGSGGAVARVREALGVTFKYNEEFEAEVERMVQESLTNKEFDRIVAQLYPTNTSDSKLKVERAETHRANVRSLFEASATLDNVRGTRWAGYNAVTEYMDYYLGVAGKKSKDSLADARAKSYFDGNFEARKNRAFQLLSV